MYFVLGALYLDLLGTSRCFDKHQSTKDEDQSTVCLLFLIHYPNQSQPLTAAINRNPRDATNSR